MRNKKEIIKEFIDVSEKPDFPESNHLQFLEILIDIRDELDMIRQIHDNCGSYFNEYLLKKIKKIL